MKRMLLAAAIAAQVGCGGMGRIMEYGTNAEKVYFNLEEGTYYLYDRPEMGKMMVSATFGNAFVHGLARGATFGGVNIDYSYRKIAKAVALKSGPMHPCGLTIAEIINHAANYWKHHDEWNLPFNKAREKRARETLAALLAVDPDYPLTTILRAVVFVRSNRLQGLLPHLRAWRDDMLRADPTPTKRPR